MLKATLALAALGTVLVLPCVAQDSNFGFTAPLTISGGVLRTQRLPLDEPGHTPWAEGFRVMAYPTLKLGSHWFAYAAVQVRMTPYFYYDAFEVERELRADAIQAYLGYTTRFEKTTIVVKAGQLATAFGSFPLRYDEIDNPLLDQPLSYVTRLPLRGDQLICNTPNLLHQYYGYVEGYCGGTPGDGGGLTPVSLYGLPGIQVEASGGHFDGRLQLTARSPAVSERWTTRLNYLQWAAGGGVTIRQGFRIGASGFRGPYFDRSVSSFLPAGTTVRDFPATGIGIDGQWARGRFSANAEWQHFQFDVPNFIVSPSTTAGYGELKTVLSPRLYVAGRAGWLKNGRVTDTDQISAPKFAPTLTSLELGGGIWLHRNLLLKGSYGWLLLEGQTNNMTNIFGFQLVANIHSLNWAFRQ